MGVVEDAVDTAADFIGPLLDKDDGRDRVDSRDPIPQDQNGRLVENALFHLQAINTADQAKDLNAPYDGSLVGVVYGLLDMIASQGILPSLSPGVVFAHRPQSVLKHNLLPSPPQDFPLLCSVVQTLYSIFEQGGTGVQPLLTQRVLPDLISALAELAFSPKSSPHRHSLFRASYEDILDTTPTSRLLPILTSYLQQDIPLWLRERLSKQLARVPLRTRGIRHTIEFMSLAYMSKTSPLSPDQSSSLSQIPIPLEAITQASRLLASVPNGMSATEWFTELAPQLWSLLDGTEGPELSRAAGQIIAGGILNKKSSGAPGTIGWTLFAEPLLQCIRPESSNYIPKNSTSEVVLVDEHELKVALKRMFTIVSSHSHPGLIKRLVGPILLPLWGLVAYTRCRPALDAQWGELPRNIMLRYMSIAVHPMQINIITTNLFWDGEPSWSFGPGSQGGVEIRERKKDDRDISEMADLLSQIEKLDERVDLLTTLLTDAKIDDEIASSIFLNVTKRWLTAGRGESHVSLTDNGGSDPLVTLADAKLSETMARRFKNQLARSPRHVIELMGQLLQDFAEIHQSKSRPIIEPNKPSRASLRDIVRPQFRGTQMPDSILDTESEELVSFALSILNTLITSSDFKRVSNTMTLFSPILPSLQYLSQLQQHPPVSPLIINAATNLLQILQPTSSPPEESQPRNRVILQQALTDLTSPDPPNRTWALSMLRKIVQDPNTFSLVDIPSLTHMILSSSIADSESYVHTAAIPVLVDVVTRAPNPTLRILVDAFIDLDEQSLQLKKERELHEPLDSRLRVGEVLNNFILEDGYWTRGSNASSRFSNLKLLTEATLSLASRRGQRSKTHSRRNELLELKRKEQEEGERAWGGPIPNIIDARGDDSPKQYEEDRLLKVVQGWEDTGDEEDVRIRASALSIFSSIMEKRLELLSQKTVDVALQMNLTILMLETGAEKGILRRAAVLVFMGLLRGIDASIKTGTESVVGLGIKQSEEVERVIKWVATGDPDDLVRSHAESVLDGLETWRMKRLFKIRGEGVPLGHNFGLEESLRGLGLTALGGENKTRGRGPAVEEVE
ncbi:uncharacterized protein BDR25DRAFT_284325 [Lindgomyces ingoldianus]|uniref:Uncharacterized protein n=1 Tax=Lindgomyces ingoldianus TaxID=673940 RepID=A0ACB6QYC0_9PLEO|nr:uncharacterized protein BDR25DRAFT_284325 [Lindgomyces ingoldianus]KAF2471974.1 hypothetical protein BDR25DRAFT_284325 [Lindgomyces ingoldianus]